MITKYNNSTTLAMGINLQNYSIGFSRDNCTLTLDTNSTTNLLSYKKFYSTRSKQEKRINFLENLLSKLDLTKYNSNNQETQ